MKHILLGGAALAALLAMTPVGARAATDEQKKDANAVVDKNAQTIWDIGDSIYYFGEMGMQEFEATKLLKDTMEAAGFKVELGQAGMPTNFWATYGSGHPYIVIESEIDALPGGNQTPLEFEHKPMVPGAPGHMEGHNTHGGVATAAAFAVKQVMDKYHLPGTIAVNFGPAEEEIASRPFIVRSGAFKDVDANIYLHIGENFGTGYGLQNYAAIGVQFAFHGKTAHAAVDPWDGKNALDALELMDDGVAFLRQQMKPTYRIHRSIMAGGIQPNVIPDFTKVWYFVRDANMPDAKATYDKLLDIAKGADLMTGTTHDVIYQASAWPALSNKALAQVVQKNFKAVGLPKWSDEEQKFARDFQAAEKYPVVGLATSEPDVAQKPQSTSSNDSGDISWVVPSVVYTFPASVPGIPYHNWVAAVTPTSTIAHKGEVAGAKALADSVLDFMTSPDVLKAAHDEFEQATKTTPYFSLVPDGAKPDTDLDKEIMAQYRPEMSKFYLHKTPRYQP
ncbi:MAG TPA: amidohydrolase [Stellaceae bacterium]|jgi:aminobenzoyl-glutamate utilization protein B